MKHMWTPWRMAYILSDKEDDCVFCDMLEAADDRESLVLHRGERAFLVLNKYPYNNGHLMAVPYRHVDTLEALTAAELADVMALVTLGMRALRAAMQPEGFNIGVNIGKVAGAGVEDHVHVHIVPRWTGDTNFMPVFGEVRVIPQALCETYDLLKTAVDAILTEGILDKVTR
ncbi:MAG: HIT family hydrolase [Chloroflexi bacterium HGW-Chloroflexi-1]|nr:MAG: HIT family hydrolase [Chloroflexi bacterium HGW-Chloroflexi-1]